MNFLSRRKEALQRAQDYEGQLPPAESDKAMVNQNVHSTDISPSASTLNVIDVEEEAPLTGPQLYAILVALILAVFLMTLNASILATAIPQITSTFDTVADIGWYSSAYLLANCSLGPLSGKIYTYCNLKWTFLVFLGLFELGSLLSALAHNSPMFIVARAIAGVGGSGIFNGAVTILAASVPLERRPTLIGIATSFAGISQLAGPIVGGAITEHLSWRWCFWIDLPPGAVTVLLLCFIRIPNGTRKEYSNMSWKAVLKQLDIPGFVLFAPSIVMLLLATQWGGFKYSWSSATIIGMFCGSFVMFVLFIIWQFHRGEKAMIPPKFFKDPIVACSCLTSFLQFGALLLITTYLPLWFQTVKRKSPLQSGVDTLPTMIAQLFSAASAGKLISVLGYVAPIALAGSVASSIGSGLMASFTMHTTTAQWIGYQILAGYGRGIVVQAPITATQAVLKPKELPVGSSMVVFCQYFGGALFLSLGQTLFVSRLKSGLVQRIPGIDTDLIVHSGATNISKIPIAFWPVILEAYNEAITQTFYMAAGGAALACLTSCGMGWKRNQIKKAEEQALLEKDDRSDRSDGEQETRQQARVPGGAC